MDGLLAEPITAEDERAGAAVPDRDSEHAAKPLEEVDPPLLVRVREDLRVVARGQPVALRDQLRAERFEVVELAVLDRNDVAGLIEHRLMAVLEIDDREPAHANRPVTPRLQALVVGSAVAD